MDFPNAKLPVLTPLKNSVAQSNFAIEDELRNLFIQLFSELLSSETFDVNVLGMAHLGSLDLVRKSVNADGLVLLEGDREETATRYIYRAWKSRNCQGRGLYFLVTYLQMLFPNSFDVDQMYQDKAYTYPNKLIPNGANNSSYFLTSRIRVMLDSRTVTIPQIDKMTPILRAVIPARLLLFFGLVSKQKRTNYLGLAAKSVSTTIVYPLGFQPTYQNNAVLTAIAARSISIYTIYPKT